MKRLVFSHRNIVASCPHWTQRQQCEDYRAPAQEHKHLSSLVPRYYKQNLLSPFSFMARCRNGDSLVHTAVHSSLSRRARFTRHVAYAYRVGREITALQFIGRSERTRLQDDWRVKASFGGASSRMCYNGITQNFAWVMLSPSHGCDFAPSSF